MTAPYILAKTMKEAHAFAESRLGLQRGRYRVVTSPASISGPRGADLHLVPGWEKRYDHFAMKGALRYTRLNLVEETPTSVAITDDLEPAGEQLTLDMAIDDATDWIQAELDSAVADWQEMPETAKKVVDAPHWPKAEETVIEKVEEGKPKRRRRRCKDCGVLVEPDDVDQHKKDHENDLVGAV